MVTITAAIAPTSANINECASLRSEEWDVLQVCGSSILSNKNLTASSVYLGYLP
jgi:hypothetical protein